MPANLIDHAQQGYTGFIEEWKKSPMHYPYKLVSAKAEEKVRAAVRVGRARKYVSNMANRTIWQQSVLVPSQRERVNAKVLKAKARAREVEELEDLAARAMARVRAMTMTMTGAAVSH